MEKINYKQMVDEAMMGVVKKCLLLAQKQFLSAENHFYISFLTKAPGVIIADYLISRFPQEMTIVLQFEYQDLTVQDDHFSVVLSFNDKLERLIIPYRAITSFADPADNFGIQFLSARSAPNNSLASKITEIAKEEKQAPKVNSQNPKSSSNVISFFDIKKNKS
jgi:hypothetical protein